MSGMILEEKGFLDYISRERILYAGCTAYRSGYGKYTVRQELLVGLDGTFYVIVIPRVCNVRGDFIKWGTEEVIYQGKDSKKAIDCYNDHY